MMYRVSVVIHLCNSGVHCKLCVDELIGESHARTSETRMIHRKEMKLCDAGEGGALPGPAASQTNQRCLFSRAPVELWML